MTKHRIICFFHFPPLEPNWSPIGVKSVYCNSSYLVAPRLPPTSFDEMLWQSEGHTEMSSELIQHRNGNDQVD